MLQMIDIYGRLIAAKNKALTDVECRLDFVKDVSSFIGNDIISRDRFSVFTLYPNPWPQELMPIYDHFQDEHMAASFLGRLVYDIVSVSDKNWLCIKTDHLRRDYAVMFYWVKV